ncbi:MAG: hypothetical protein Q9226_004031 [Calogaya cf. arnoldii]
MTYFYIWTQTALNLSLMISTMPCLKPFVASLNTGYGAFDTEHVASVYGSTYGSSGNHNPGSYPPQKRAINSRSRSKWGNKIASGKSVPNSDHGRDSTIGRAVLMPQQAAINDGSEIGVATTPMHNHHRQPSLFDAALGLAPEGNAGRDKNRGGEGQATHTHSASAVAQDGNSIGSDDSRQMIIRKDVTWAVEYSDPSSQGR